MIRYVDGRGQKSKQLWDQEYATTPLSPPAVKIQFQVNRHLGLKAAHWQHTKHRRVCILTIAHYSM
jgi:hypothetical protein